MTPRRAFIVDFDNVLLNTEAVRSSWIKFARDKYKISKTKFQKTYRKAKNRSGYLNVTRLAKLLKVEANFFMNTPFKKFLFPEISADIRRLKKMGPVFVVSLGDNHYQPKKIKDSGIEKLIGKQKLRVTQNKNVALKKVITKLLASKYQIIVIDDMAKTLADTKKTFPEAITIWVRFGKYKNTQPKNRKAIDRRVKSFSEAVRYLNNEKL